MTERHYHDKLTLFSHDLLTSGFMEYYLNHFLKAPRQRDIITFFCCGISQYADFHNWLFPHWHLLDHAEIKFARGIKGKEIYVRWKWRQQIFCPEVKLCFKRC